MGRVGTSYSKQVVPSAALKVVGAMYAPPSSGKYFLFKGAKGQRQQHRTEVRAGKVDYGFNARTEEYENLFAAGVIDPTKVTRIALENAASIASMLLTTECVISDEKEEKAAGHSHGGGMGDMGGMM